MMTINQVLLHDKFIYSTVKVFLKQPNNLFLLWPAPSASTNPMSPAMGLPPWSSGVMGSGQKHGEQRSS